MLRLTFWILLVANVVMFAATQTYTGAPVKKDEPQSLQPIRTEKIRLLPSVLMSPQSKPAATSATEKVETTSCLEIGEFDAAGAKLFEEKTKAFMPADSLERLLTPGPSSFMVYLPPAPNKKTAEKRITELQKKGIGNYFLITNGKQFRNAISLGIFKNEETAKNLVAKLQKLGFDDVTTHARTRPAESTSYMIKNADKTQMQQLELVLAYFPHTSKKECTQQNNFAKEN